MSRPRWISLAGSTLLAAMLAGCAALLGPRTLSVPQAQLQERIDREFPLDNRFLELLDVHVAAPRLTLLPAVNRLATECDISVGDRIFKVAHRGTIAMSYGVRFEASDNTVRLMDVKVERISIDGTPSLQRELDRLGVQIAERALNDRTIYTLRPKDIEIAQGHGYRPSELRVTGAGLSITLVPIGTH